MTAFYRHGITQLIIHHACLRNHVKMYFLSHTFFNLLVNAKKNLSDFFVILRIRVLNNFF